MKTSIRFHQAKDMKAINAICNECWLFYYQALAGPRKVQAVVKSRLQKPRKFLKSNRTNFTLVATQQGTVLGYAVGAIWKKTGKVLALYVKPSNIGKGIGTKLLKRCFSEFKKRNCSRITVETLFNNKNALRFYKRFGFQKNKTAWFRTRGIRFRVWKLKKKTG